MDRADVARWLDDYVEAWKTYDRDRIAALFTDDVEYRYHPYDDPVRGRDAVVDSWLGEGDQKSVGEGPGGHLRRHLQPRGRRWGRRRGYRIEHLLRAPGRARGQGLRQLLRDAVRRPGPVPRVHRVVHQAPRRIASGA